MTCARDSSNPWAPHRLISVRAPFRWARCVMGSMKLAHFDSVLSGFASTDRCIVSAHFRTTPSPSRAWGIQWVENPPSNQGWPRLSYKFSYCDPMPAPEGSAIRIPSISGSNRITCGSYPQASSGANVTPLADILGYQEVLVIRRSRRWRHTVQPPTKAQLFTVLLNHLCSTQFNGSISLSPLYPSPKSDLHVSTSTSLHQSFLWLHPAQA